MVQVEAAASWNKFYVIVAGRTNGAHEAIVKRLCDSGHTEVFSPEDSDYLLVFCPVASRVGTDIGEALQNIKAGKPVILVVMHHTFDSHHIVADSSRQVDDRNVRLTVDYLFFEGRLLISNRNDAAWDEIQQFLGLPVFSDSICQCFINWTKKHPMQATAGIVSLVGLTVIVLKWRRPNLLRQVYFPYRKIYWAIGMLFPTRNYDKSIKYHSLEQDRKPFSV